MGGCLRVVTSRETGALGPSATQQITRVGIGIGIGCKSVCTAIRHAFELAPLAKELTRHLSIVLANLNAVTNASVDSVSGYPKNYALLNLYTLASSSIFCPKTETSPCPLLN